MTPFTLALRYGLFALVAIGVNLATQRLTLRYVPDLGGITFAVLAGTIAGLVIKYLLDKTWIFHDRSSGFRAHGRKFTLYAAMGLTTTMIFWVSEFIFWVLWQTDLMREAGAILGLITGYVIKYRLDKKFVFNKNGKRIGRVKDQFSI